MRRRRDISGDRNGSSRRRSIFCFAVLLGLALAAPAARANTTVFTNTNTCTIPTLCRNLSDFGVLVGTTNDNLTISSGNWLFDGGIGIGTTSNLQRNGGVTQANDIVDFADTLSTGSNCNNSRNVCGSGKWTGSLTKNSTLVNSAESQLDAILTALGGSKFATGASLSAGTPLNITTGMSNNIKVYTTSGFTQNQATITLGCGGSTCAANDLVVINVSGTSLTLNGNVILTDGLTADQVVWYAGASGASITIGSASSTPITVKGDFFMKNGKVIVGGALGNTNVFGRIYNDNGDITFTGVGGSQNDPGPVPEPATWGMMGGGVAAVIALARRQKKKQTAAPTTEAAA